MLKTSSLFSVPWSLGCSLNSLPRASDPTNVRQKFSHSELKLTCLRSIGLYTFRLLDSITGSMNMNDSKSWEIVEDGHCRHATVHGVTKSQT